MDPDGSIQWEDWYRRACTRGEATRAGPHPTPAARSASEAARGERAILRYQLHREIAVPKGQAQNRTWPLTWPKYAASGGERQKAAESGVGRAVLTPAPPTGVPNSFWDIK